MQTTEQRQKQRLREARRKLAKAKRHQEYVEPLEPTWLTSEQDIRQMQIKAADAVRKWTVSVRVREELLNKTLTQKQEEAK